MVARINTVAFQGVDVQNVDVQVQISAGMPAFMIVGYKRHIFLIVVLIFCLIPINAKAFTKIECDPQPIIKVINGIDVLFYGSIEPQSLSELKANGHMLPSVKFDVIESFKGVSENAKKMELNLFPKATFITDEDHLVKGKYKEGKLYLAFYSGCRSQAEILKFLHASLFEQMTETISYYIKEIQILIFAIIILGLYANKKRIISGRKG